MEGLRLIAFRSLTDAVIRSIRAQNDDWRDNIYIDSDDLNCLRLFACAVDITRDEDTGRIHLQSAELHEDKEGDGEYDFADRQLTELFYTIIDKECTRLSDENQAQIATDRGYYDMISEYWVCR